MISAMANKVIIWARMALLSSMETKMLRALNPRTFVKKLRKWYLDGVVRYLIIANNEIQVLISKRQIQSICF